MMTRIQKAYRTLEQRHTRGKIGCARKPFVASSFHSWAVSQTLDTRAATAPARMITIPTYAFAPAKAGTTNRRSMDR